MSNPQRYSMDLDGYGYVETPDDEGEYVRFDDLAIHLRRSLLAGLALNLVDCPCCHLPRADGRICPCGYDGVDCP
jgi:hypothetical protein